MHVLVAFLFGLLTYLTAMLYSMFDAPEYFLTIVFTGPVIISGTIMVMITIDNVCWLMGAKRRASIELDQARARELVKRARRA